MAKEKGTGNYVQPIAGQLCSAFVLL